MRNSLGFTWFQPKSPPALMSVKSTPEPGVPVKAAARAPSKDEVLLGFEVLQPSRIQLGRAFATMKPTAFMLFVAAFATFLWPLAFLIYLLPFSYVFGTRTDADTEHAPTFHVNETYTASSDQDETFAARIPFTNGHGSASLDADGQHVEEQFWSHKHAKAGDADFMRHEDRKAPASKVTPETPARDTPTRPIELGFDDRHVQSASGAVEAPFTEEIGAHATRDVATTDEKLLKGFVHEDQPPEVTVWVSTKPRDSKTAGAEFVKPDSTLVEAALGENILAEAQPAAEVVPWPGIAPDDTWSDRGEQIKAVPEETERSDLVPPVVVEPETAEWPGIAADDTWSRHAEQPKDVQPALVAADVVQPGVMQSDTAQDEYLLTKSVNLDVVEPEVPEPAVETPVPVKADTVSVETMAYGAATEPDKAAALEASEQQSAESNVHRHRMRDAVFAMLKPEKAEQLGAARRDPAVTRFEKWNAKLFKWHSKRSHSSERLSYKLEEDRRKQSGEYPVRMAQTMRARLVQTTATPDWESASPRTSRSDVAQPSAFKP